MLEKKEKVLQKKASTEVEKAKDFTRAKNKRGIGDPFVLSWNFHVSRFCIANVVVDFVLE